MDICLYSLEVGQEPAELVETSAPVEPERQAA